MKVACVCAKLGLEVLDLASSRLIRLAEHICFSTTEKARATRYRLCIWFLGDVPPRSYFLKMATLSSFILYLRLSYRLSMKDTSLVLVSTPSLFEPYGRGDLRLCKATTLKQL